MRILTLITGIFIGLATHVQASPTPNPQWGSHTLNGWWNPHSLGPKPATTLTGYDYIVVGSGPGGAPLAARLGLAGHRVLVIEAGQDEAPTDSNITVPYFNAKASEDPKISWTFFVNHYPDLARGARDPKYNYKLANGSLYTGLNPPAGAMPLGTFYPRSAAIGGCASHNALIMMYPLEDDWNQLVNVTDDESWSAANMRTYFERFEDCQYLARGTPGHGFDGWLATNRANETTVFLTDNKVYQMLKAAGSLVGQIFNSVTELTTLLLRDLNTVSPEYATEKGLFNTPLCMDEYKRSNPRDFLVNTAQAVNNNARHGGRIDIRTSCLVTRVIFAPGTTRAIGVEFLDGQSLYRADPRASSTLGSGTPGVAFATKEVILAGGAYNTPQLLKLSGVGPSSELMQHGIPLMVDLPGVGSNLQDRYENSVISQGSQPYTSFAGCTSGLNASDPCLEAWYAMQDNQTKYATNGRPVLIPMRSSVALNPSNDLVVTGRPGYFAGYFFGYSTISRLYPNAWTWPVLKAHTQNRAGTVTLRSADPRDVPTINFNYFDAGSGNWQYDLAAVVEAMQFARNIFATFAQQTGLTQTEISPGAQYQTQEQLAQWVKDTSWGHHASCSCPIGADGDAMAVLDSKFRVRGTAGLRVVDASVFPTIPGFYVQTSVYMVSEKAAEVIGGDAGGWEGYNSTEWERGGGGWMERGA